jgi:hypothetical protein
MRVDPTCLTPELIQKAESLVEGPAHQSIDLGATYTGSEPVTNLDTRRQHIARGTTILTLAYINDTPENSYVADSPSGFCVELEFSDRRLVAVERIPVGDDVVVEPFGQRVLDTVVPARRETKLQDEIDRTALQATALIGLALHYKQPE